MKMNQSAFFLNLHLTNSHMCCVHKYFSTYRCTTFSCISNRTLRTWWTLQHITIIIIVAAHHIWGGEGTYIYHHGNVIHVRNENIFNRKEKTYSWTGRTVGSTTSRFTRISLLFCKYILGRFGKNIFAQKCESHPDNSNTWKHLTLGPLGPGRPWAPGLPFLPYMKKMQCPDKIHWTIIGIKLWRNGEKCAVLCGDICGILWRHM